MRERIAQHERKENVIPVQAQPQSEFAGSRTGQPDVASALLKLQRTHGNQFVQCLLRLDRKAGSVAEVAPEVEDTIQSARGGGHILDHGVRGQMEHAFGVDFSGVRVHTDTRAEALNRALSARAFTVGQDIFFSRGEYNLERAAGRELLAHELTHVVQQNRRGVSAKLEVGYVGDQYEEEADRVARAVMQSETQFALDRTRDNTQDPMPIPAGVDRRVQREPLGEGARAGIGALAGGAIGAGIGALVGGPIGAAVGGAVGAGIGALAGWLAGLRVSVPGHVRARSTPKEMTVDRIPPRVDTPIAATVAGLGSGAPPVTLSVEGASAANGTVTIDGAATKDLRGSATVQLQGVTQTTAGNGGKLHLVAKQGATELDRSGGFSVSAIPQNYNDVFDSLLTGTVRGFVVKDSWESDSGAVPDLDQTEISEEIEITSSTGCFSGTGKSTSGYLPGNAFSTDTHSTPVAILTGPGVRVAQQTCKFKDKRTGATDIPMTKSGYRVTRTVTEPVSGSLQIETKKVGAATTANGIKSEAGSGSITKTQAV